MRAFITGAAGFVGANLVIRLIRLGTEVHILVRETSSLWRLQSIINELHIHVSDLNDSTRLHQLLQKIHPDIIYHLASHGAYHYQRNQKEILQTTIFGTLNLLNAAIATNVQIVINTGSSSEYGTKDHPMKEGELIEPNSYYAVGKSAQTLLCQQFAREEKLPVITLRLFSVYGPFEEPGRLVPTLIQRATLNQDLPLARPDTARDFIYVDDVVKAYLETARHPEHSGNIFNIGSGKQSSLEDIVSNIITITKSASRPIWNAYPSRPFDTSIWVADIQKSHNLLNFQATTSLEEGLRKHIKWFTEHKEAYQL